MNATEIISYLTTAAEEKQVLSADAYLRAARSLVLFLGDEKDKLIELESQVAQMRLNLKNSDSKESVSGIKMVIEASSEYKEARKQKAKIEQIIEWVRLAKAGARLAEEEMRHQNIIGLGN
jgi:phage-related minor tail protein